MKRSLLAQSIRTITLMAMGGGALAPALSHAEELLAKADKIDEVTVVGDALRVLPTEPVESVFGFGKTLLETPRAATSISNEMLNKTNITQLNDLVALTPGSFTQSFFGVAGSLDVRGTPGENYFRGVRRIDNPGNYPMPIGASDRIDVVRGPASPIYGPSKIGGYLNFIPKSARASTGQFMSEPKGEVGVTLGSWDKKVLHAEVGGPSEVFGKSAGYYLYAESENSGSYYQNTSTIQSLYQASFDMDLTDSLRIESGGMYQDFKGNQVAGWNRLTQDLIDHGTYITGSPASLDANGDGKLSQTEAANGNLGLFLFNPKGMTAADVNAALAAHPNMALQNPGTTHINGSQVLTQEDDTLEDQVVTLYADLKYDAGNGFNIVNKSFYESLDNLNENVYGFSQYAKTWVFEDQLIFSYGQDFGSFAHADFQLSPSVRHQDFEHGDDFDYEYFDRRDITQAGTPIDRRALATRDADTLYSDHTKGNYTDYGLAFMVDSTFFEKLHFLGGTRYDFIDVTSKSLADTSSHTGTVLSASDQKDASSWTASLTYDLPMGFKPYVTVAKQTTMIVGQGGQIDESNVASGNAVADSTLEEFGIKASLLDDQLYIAVDHFDQKRVDFNAQDTVTNNTTKSIGYEAEFRWVATQNITLTGAYTSMQVYNLSALENGVQFSFAGAEDLPAGVDPSLIYGGVVPSLVLVSNSSDARKAGIPEEMYSLNLIYSFDGMFSGLTASIGATHVDSVYAGFSQSVKLPAYTLINGGLNYETDHWKLGLQGKNLTNERYFRSNFPDLFGSSVVLPEVPRNYLVSAAYKF